MELRRAEVADAAAIAALHVAVWRVAYADLAPVEALARLDEGQRRRQWTERLGPAGGSAAVLLAEDGEDLAGFLAYGPPRHAPLAGMVEILALYVDVDRQGQGVGRRLMARAFDEIRAEGDIGIGLAVVDGNAPARGFYAALGGVEVAEVLDPGPIWKCRDLIVVWPPGVPLAAG